jgi:hypothetical protein
MKKIASLLLSVVLASSAFAGPAAFSGKSGKGPVAPMAPAGCNCFAPGAAVGIYGAAILGNNDDALGIGLLGEYFFTEMLGIQGSYGAFNTDSTHHEFDAALIARFPIKSICVAPYAMVGGGFSTNSSTQGNFFAGAGLEARISSANCLGIFADGAYHWGADFDYTIVRLGVKFPF